jgi:hypothetical protein
MLPDALDASLVVAKATGHSLHEGWAGLVVFESRGRPFLRKTERPLLVHDRAALTRLIEFA